MSKQKQYKINKMPKVRVLRRIVDDVDVRYMPQFNHCNGWGWYYTKPHSSVGDVLRHGLKDQPKERLEMLFNMYQLDYEYRSDWGMLFKDLNRAIKFADDLYSLYEAAYPVYKKYIENLNEELAALDKDGAEMYRKPPKWEWLKNIFG